MSLLHKTSNVGGAAVGLPADVIDGSKLLISDHVPLKYEWETVVFLSACETEVPCWFAQGVQSLG